MVKLVRTKFNAGVQDGIHAYRLYQKYNGDSDIPAQTISYHENDLHPNKSYSFGWVMGWKNAIKYGADAFNKMLEEKSKKELEIKLKKN